jgi:hypothetical protein
MMLRLLAKIKDHDDDLRKVVKDLHALSPKADLDDFKKAYDTAKEKLEAWKVTCKACEKRVREHRANTADESKSKAKRKRDQGKDEE